MSNRRLINPHTGTHCFGIVHEAKCRDVILPAGEIYLPFGRHSGPNRGFGACHIWAEHAKEMAACKLYDESNVPDYVAMIVRAGTPLFFEGGHITKTRLMAVRGQSGTAILELREARAETYWSVVTAFSANKKHGVLVGTVLDVVCSQ